MSRQIGINTHWSSESKHHPHSVSVETAAGVCVVAAFDDAISAPAHPASLAHPPIAQALWLRGQLLARVPVHVR